MDLLKLSGIFYKISSIKSDMANRTMYGIISQMAETVDYPALEVAVHGAKDIIRYGSVSAYNEIENHFKGDNFYKNFSSFSNIKNEQPNKNNLQKYILYLNLFESLFESEGWDPGYGGKAWAKIVKYLRDISESYFDFLTTEKYSKENIKAANNVIIAMNLFDGLAHNTGSIYNKLILEEYADKKISTNPRDIDILMDAKELKDPIDTFNLIKKDLPIDLPYKEYIQKLKTTPLFYNRDKRKVEEELDTISFIRKTTAFALTNKDITNIKEQINVSYAKILSFINKDILSINDVDDTVVELVSIENIIEKFYANIDYILYVVNDYKNFLAVDFYNKMKKLFEEIKVIKNEFSNIREIIENIKNEYNQIQKFSSHLFSIKNKLFSEMDSYLSIINILQ